MLSIVKNQDESVSFCCVCLDLKEENVDLLLRLEFGVQIRVYQFNHDVDTGHWPKTTLLRVFSPWLLDMEIEKILYMDADMLCCGSLSELFELNPEWIAMGNEISGNVSQGPKHGQKRFSDDYPVQLYCNAGVVVMNLKNIREHYDFEAVFSVCLRICDEYYCNDQDFLNIFFLDKITHFNGLRFNFQAYELKGSMFYKLALSECKMIHFSAAKPWKDNGDRENMRLYLKHSEYPPMREMVKKAYRKNIYKAPYRALYKLCAKTKHLIFK
jgi:lipopolysaccharide biosynthesis glycosyltransferase